MSITSQIISGSQSALNLIKTALANPSIAPALEASREPMQDPTKIVSFQCESYKENLPSEVSQQLIVDISQGKQYISDNIAPKPRSWDLKGFIAVAPYELIASPILQLSQARSLGYLREMRNSRQMLAFRTKNGGEIVLVGISSLVIDSDPSIQNRIPFSMTVNEVPVLTFTDNSGLGIPSGTSNPASDATSVGTVQSIATAVSTNATLLEGLL